MTISLFIKLNESLLLSAPSFLFIGKMEPRKLNNSTTNSSTIDTTNRSSTLNNNDTFFILSISFILMIIIYIGIIKIYCIHNNHKKINNKNNKTDIEYEPLFNNYGTLEEF